MVVTRAAAAVILLSSVSLACASVQPVREPSRFIAETHPKVIFLTHRSRALLAVEAPSLSGDTVVGTWQGSTRPIAVPLSQITSVTARQHDRQRTTLLVVGMTTLAAVTVFAVVEANKGDALDCDYAKWPPRCAT